MSSISRKSRSILDEISSFVPSREKADIVETRAQHILTSTLNLFETIDSSFTPDEANNLKNRFISSLKNSDTSRFSRAVARLKESKK